MLPKTTRTTTSKRGKPDATGHTTTATFAHWTADDFHAEKWRQINALLIWQAYIAAAGEDGVVQ